MPPSFLGALVRKLRSPSPIRGGRGRPGGRARPRRGSAGAKASPKPRIRRPTRAPGRDSRNGTMVASSWFRGFSTTRCTTGHPPEPRFRHAHSRRCGRVCSRSSHRPCWRRRWSRQPTVGAPKVGPRPTAGAEEPRRPPGWSARPRWEIPRPRASGPACVGSSTSSTARSMPSSSSAGASARTTRCGRRWRTPRRRPDA